MSNPFRLDSQELSPLNVHSFCINFIENKKEEGWGCGGIWRSVSTGNAAQIRTLKKAAQLVEDEAMARIEAENKDMKDMQVMKAIRENKDSPMKSMRAMKKVKKAMKAISVKKAVKAMKAKAKASASKAKASASKAISVKKAAKHKK